MRRESTDVLVIGGGPAGMAAALAAAECGREVCLVDDNPSVGGQIWRRDVAASEPSEGPAMVYRRALVDAGVELRLRTVVADVEPPNAAVVFDGHALTRIEADRIVLATGARELLLPFPGWTLPGVFGVGGLQALAKGGLSVRGKRVVVAGTGPLLLAVAASLRARGAELVAVVEQASTARLARFGLGLLSSPSKLWQGLALNVAIGQPLRTGAWVARAEGTEAIERVVIESGGREETIGCDLLACGYGLVPQTRVARLLGCTVGEFIEVDALQRTSRPEVLAAGEPCGIGGQQKAEIEGRIAGLVAAGDEASARPLLPARDRWRRFAARLDRDFALRPELRQLADADTIVCRCEDVRLSAVRRYPSARAAKLATRCGMGPCQGRTCQPALRFLLGHGHDRPRPPLVPLPLGVLAEPRGVSP